MTKIGGSTGSPSTPPTTSVDSAQKASEGHATATGKAQEAQPAGQAQAPKDKSQITEQMFAAQFAGIKLQAQAERELPAVQKNQKVDITDPEMRNQMMRSAPQVNEISKKAGNENDICGGAAMTNALIMSSKTPEQAKANAQAVRDLANSFTKVDKENKSKTPFAMSAQEQQALKNMESGKMSPNDTMHMQQLMYRIGQRMPLAGSNPSGAGLSTTQIACAMTKLKANGAFPGNSDVRMHCTTLPTGADHWTVSVDRIHANSAGGKDYNKSLVTGGPPPEVQKGSDKWQNEIIIDNNAEPAPKVYAQFKQPGDTNQYREATFDPNQHKDISSFGAFENEIRRAASAPAHQIQ
jgi:hypothetical protein